MKAATEHAIGGPTYVPTPDTLPAYLDKSISAGATAPPPPHVRSAIPQGASIAPTGGASAPAKPPAKPDAITQDYKDQGKLLEDLAENKALTNDISAQGLEGLGKLQGTQAVDTEQRAAADYADSKKIIDNYNTSSEQAAAFKRDPERFMHDSNLLKKGLMVLAVGLGSIGSGLRGGPNPVLDDINKMIDRDIENQQRQYEQLKARGQDVQNQYSMNLKALGNREAAVQASRGQTVDAFKNHINAQTIGTGSPLLINQGKLASKELDTTNDLRLQARADAAAKSGAGGGLGNYDKMLMEAVKEEQTNIREGVSPPADMAEIIRRAKARVPINGQFPKVDVQGSYGPKTPKPGKEDAALTREAAESELAHKKLVEVNRIIQAGGKTGVWGANRSAAVIGGNEAKMARLQGESARGTLSKATEATIEAELPNIPRTDIMGFDRDRSTQAVAAALERANDLRARQGKPPLPPDVPSEEDLNSIGFTK
jgi:hypothetical protein